MHAILLAAGLSVRLEPLSDKNLLEFCGKPLIEHRALSLMRTGFKEIVVVGNRTNLGAFKRIFKKYPSVAVVGQKKPEEGMAGGVMAGAQRIHSKSVLILSANDLFEDELIAEVVRAAKKAADGAVVGKKMQEYFPGGYLNINRHGELTGIIEKPGKGNEPSKLVNIVLHMFNDFPKFAAELQSAKTKKDDRYEAALDRYIKKCGAKMRVLEYDGVWQPIKFPWHVLTAMRWFLEKQKSGIDLTAHVSASAVIRGHVAIGPRVKVYENAVIHGPAYIGEGSVVATNALVRESMVGRNSVIGFTTEIARSYLNHDVWTHTNYIGDSVVDSHVSFGSGAVLGNLRFDEENVRLFVQGKRLDTGASKFGAVVGSGARLGINSCTNPGVKIGKNVFVGGGLLIEKDVPNGKLALPEQKIKIADHRKKINAKSRAEMKKKL